MAEAQTSLVLENGSGNSSYSTGTSVFYTGVEHRRNETYGYILLFISTVFMTFMMGIIRFIDGYNKFPAASTTILYGLTQGGLALLFGSCLPSFRTSLVAPQDVWRTLFLFSVFSGMAFGFGNAALTYVSLGVDGSIYYTAPIITIFMSCIILGEQVTPLEIMSAIITLIGAILVTDPTLSMPDKLESTYVLGCFLSLLNGVFNAVATICRRAMGHRIHFIAETMYMGFGVFAMGITMSVATRIPVDHLGLHDAVSVLLALLSGVFGFVGQCFLAEGFVHARAGPGSVVQSADLPMVYIFAIIFLGEIPSLVSIFGSFLVVLVVLAALVVTYDALNRENEIE